MKRKAFTLIELIIVIVVLGILATIAIVGYRAVIDRANQSSAENAAKSFDRQIRAQAAFGMDGNPNMTDPRRGQLILDMLTANSTDIKDIPDANVLAPSTNQLRVLVWNHNIATAGAGNWTRLCNATGCSALATGTTVGSIPVGSTANTPGSQFCLAFRKGGQTVYLGLSDRSNVPGTVSANQTVACTSTTIANGNLPAAATYNLPGGTLANDLTWG